ncbi:MAG: methylated-DNA--[protein]-cysteine S-methyltransferase [Undibacterium sp.]|jgi:methylated-DNA-[protein]-cysteine S-methyltransferase|nr:methylated-DNA--[protein]-cysteine S-methyltransferase [Undibacterium sp.]
MFYTEYQSPIGKLLLAASERGLAGVYFEEHKHFKGMDGWQRDDAHFVLQQTRLQLAAYFAGARREFDVPLDMRGGTAFQQAVWQALRTLPFGATASYAEIAKHIGNPGAVRAVGAANGRNPISIIVPCHRVIASSGALTGYAGGLNNKKLLLALEAEQA